MTLTKIYRSIIEAAGREIDEDYNVFTVIPTNERKVISTIKFNDKPLPLRLPVKKVMKERDQDAFIAFHPLSESHIRGESAVNIWLRRTICSHITTVMASLLMELLEVSTYDDVKSSADPALLPLLSATKGADHTTVKNVAKAIRRTDNEKYTLCNIFIKRDGEIVEDGEPVVYERACIVRFPISLDNPASIFDVTMRTGKIKDVEIVRALLNLILPGWDTDAYCSGSNAREAPFLRSLLGSFIKVATALNKVTKDYSSVLADEDEYLIDLKWAKHLDELYDYSGDIPMMRGNIGTQNGKEERTRVDRTVSLTDKEVTVNEPVPQPVQPQQAPQHHQPVAQPRPQQVPQQAPQSKSSGPLSYSDMMAARNVPQQPPAQQAYAPQANQYAPPVQQQAYAPQANQYAPPVHNPYDKPAPAANTYNPYVPQAPQYQASTVPQYAQPAPAANTYNPYEPQAPQHQAAPVHNPYAPPAQQYQAPPSQAYAPPAQQYAPPAQQYAPPQGARERFEHTQNNQYKAQSSYVAPW